MENKSRQEELRDNPNNRMGKTFNCAELGNLNCNWSVVGRDEDDVMQKVEQHARDEHGMSNLDDNTRSKIHDAIHDRAA